MTDNENRTNGGNEAEQMQEAYAQRQEHERQTGKTSAGGAGSTGTPGNSEVGGEATEANDGGERSSAQEN